MGMTGEQAYVLAKKLIEAGGGGGGTVDAYTKTQTDNLLIQKVDKETGKGLFSGSYNDLSDAPTIPTKTSELQNDIGYQTAEQINSAVNELLDEKGLQIVVTAKQLGLEQYPDNNMAITVHINASKEIAHANTEKINNFLLENNSKNITINFGDEAYIFDDTIDLTRNNSMNYVTLKGNSYTCTGASLSTNSDATKFLDARVRSGLYFMPSEGNKTFITTTKGSVNVIGLSIASQSFAIKNKGYSNLDTLVDPCEFIISNSLIENVNGIETIDHNSTIKDCSFRGFSGYAVKPGQASKINNLKILNCHIGIDISNTDINITDCYIAVCDYGYYCPKNWTVAFIYNAWIDQCKYGVYCEGSLNGMYNGLIDHIDGAGICAKILANFKLDARMGRCGAKYVHTDLDAYEEGTTTQAEYFDKFKDYAFVNANSIDKCQLRISAYARGLSDAKQNEYLLPKLLIFGHSMNNTIIDVVSDSKYELYKCIYENNITVLSELPTKINSIISRIEALENAHL